MWEVSTDEPIGRKRLSQLDPEVLVGCNGSGFAEDVECEFRAGSV